MNHNDVTHNCGRCGKASVVIIGGAHYCSSHGLDVTMQRALVVDLRRPEEPVVTLDLRTVALAS
ncbi:MAG: hypothetical protein OEX04_13240 [Acidimicrobiia bacterium]|nr:hypothetical protein [Acidimicrobiia bacterium]MDH4308433.1 hypothetical protein [Acidimicrobiia bacterium]